jgi:hypothetical protein
MTIRSARAIAYENGPRQHQFFSHEYRAGSESNGILPRTKAIILSFAAAKRQLLSNKMLEDVRKNPSKKPEGHDYAICQRFG